MAADTHPRPESSALRERLLEALRLKELPRAGWVRCGVAGPESVAAHSWGTAWLVLALCPPGLDRGRALAIAVIHDLAEVRVGDVTPHDGIPPAQKSDAERAALEDLVAPLPHAAELVELWQTYEEGRTPEGRFVKSCDKLDMALQARAYEAQQGLDLTELVDSALERLDDPSLRALVG